MDDTIAAIASGIGDAGIGVIRVSGKNSHAIAQSVFEAAGKNKAGLSERASHTAIYGFLKDGEQTVDEVLLIVFKGPHSYTGEDMVEIDCHGGTYVLGRAMDLLLRAGARLAEPGEFTKRAFLNGRMDLTQAEAVMDVITSENEAALTNSVRQLEGRFGQQIREIRGSILHECAYIEAALDDPEHYDLTGYSETLGSKIEAILSEMDALLSSFDEGRKMREGVRTVIAGRPNAGKSSLLNALLCEERAIVTDTPGTTRDILEETIHIAGLPVCLTDTAGLRSTDETVEQIGVGLARRALSEAEFVLYVWDATVPFTEEDAENLAGNADKKGVLIRNKSDLWMSAANEAGASAAAKPENPSLPDGWKSCDISAASGSGITELRALIKDMCLGEGGKPMTAGRTYVTNRRHKDVLVRAKEALLRAKDSAAAGLPEDFYTIDMMEAADALGTLTGETAKEDLIDEIFRSFCTGK